MGHGCLIPISRARRRAASQRARLAPDQLVEKLESSAMGCYWMLEVLEGLLERARERFWTAGDRLRMSRLLAQSCGGHRRPAGGRGFRGELRPSAVGEPFDELECEVAPGGSRSMWQSYTRCGPTFRAKAIRKRPGRALSPWCRPRSSGFGRLRRNSNRMPRKRLHGAGLSRHSTLARRLKRWPVVFESEELGGARNCGDSEGETCAEGGWRFAGLGRSARERY